MWMNNEQVIDAFLDWQRLKRQSSRNTLTKYRQVLAVFDASGEGVPFTARTTDEVEDFTSRPRRGGARPAPATVAMELSTIASLYRWGQARLGWTENPAVLAGRPRVHNRQPRPLSDETWLAVWGSVLPDIARVVLGLGYFCGLRREEITSLRGDQIHDGAIVNFIRKGGGEDRVDYDDLLQHWAAFMPELRPDRLGPVLRWQARTRGERLLVPWADNWTPANSLNRHLDAWLEAAEMPGAFTPHQLRHSFATNLLRTDVPLALASDLCNHSDPSITMRYIKTSGGRLRALRESRLGTAVPAGGRPR